jgi:hypothetical protein
MHRELTAAPYYIILNTRVAENGFRVGKINIIE